MSVHVDCMVYIIITCPVFKHASTVTGWQRVSIVHTDTICFPLQRPQEGSQEGLPSFNLAIASFVGDSIQCIQISAFCAGDEHHRDTVQVTPPFLADKAGVYLVLCWKRRIGLVIVKCMARLMKAARLYVQKHGRAHYRT